MTQDEITMAAVIQDLRIQLATAGKINADLRKSKEVLSSKNKLRLENYRQYKYKMQVYKELYEKERDRNGCRCE